MNKGTKKQMQKSLTLAETFAKLHAKNEAALVTYMLSEYPLGNALNIDVTPDVANALVNGGADIIELGVPSENPYLDGHTIKAAHSQAISAGITLDAVFNSVMKIRENTNTPIILMGYNDAVFKYNYEPDALFSEMQKCNIQGLLVPDLPVDNRKVIFKISQNYGVDLIGISTPQTPKKSLEEIISTESGFHYSALSAQTGGDLKNLNPDELETIVKNIKKYSNIPVVAGFGVKTPEDVRKISEYSDGVVIGSELIRRLNCAVPHDFKGVTNYVRELKNATKNTTRL